MPKNVFQDIVADHNIPLVIYFDACKVFDTRHTRLDDPESFNKHMARFNRYVLILVFPSMTGYDLPINAIDWLITRFPSRYRPGKTHTVSPDCAFNSAALIVVNGLPGPTTQLDACDCNPVNQERNMIRKYFISKECPEML